MTLHADVLHEFIRELTPFVPRHVCRAPSTPTWIVLKKIADNASPKLRRSFMQAVADTVNGIIGADIIDALKRGDIDLAVSAVPWNAVATPVLQDQFMGAFQTAFQQSGRVSAQIVPGVKPYSISVVDDRSITYLRDYGSQKITDYGITNRTVINDALVSAMHDGFTPQQTANLIKPFVGLSEPYAKAVSNLAGRLVESGSSQDEVMAAVARYSKQLIAARTMTIARTESQEAVGAGQHEAWLQGEDRGIIDAATAIRRWITAGDDQVRPAHEFMEGQECGLHEMFKDGDGVTWERPPAGINCRCSVELDLGD
jgi:hypothetical protein